VPRDVCKKDLHEIVRGTARALRSMRDNILDEPLPDKLAMLSKSLTEGSGEQGAPTESPHSSQRPRTRTDK
jgi:hypothetical protein